MSEDRNVTIVEVGPRDGLQNETRVISTEDKLGLIALLADAGFSRIEFGRLRVAEMGPANGRPPRGHAAS